jgi:hypothetical protein
MQLPAALRSATAMLVVRRLWDITTGCGRNGVAGKKSRKLAKTQFNPMQREISQKSGVQIEPQYLP